MYIRRILPLVINALMIFPLAAQSPQSSAQNAPPAAGTPAQGDQPADNAAQRQPHRQSALVQALNLSPDQQRKWMQIQWETVRQVRVARKDDSLTEEQMQQKLKEIHAEQKRQVIALLTPQQQEALKKWWEEQRLRHQPKNTDGASDATGVKDKDDDLFAGMVQDDPDPPTAATVPQSQSKPAPPRN